MLLLVDAFDDVGMTMTPITSNASTAPTVFYYYHQLYVTYRRQPPGHNPRFDIVITSL